MLVWMRERDRLEKAMTIGAILDRWFPSHFLMNLVFRLHKLLMYVLFGRDPRIMDCPTAESSPKINTYGVV